MIDVDAIPRERLPALLRNGFEASFAGQAQTDRWIALLDARFAAAAASSG